MERENDKEYLNSYQLLFILFFALTVISIFVLAGKGIATDIKKSYDSKCANCHKNAKEEGVDYCADCYHKLYHRVYSPEVVAEKNRKKDYSKKSYSWTETTTESSSTSSSAGKISSYSKKKSSSYTKDYSDLEFDPIDYDDPDEYADDAWEVDFDDYDDAYDYWEDY